MENLALFLSIATFVVIILLFLAFSLLLSSRRKEQNVLKRAAKWSTQAKISNVSDVQESGERKQPKIRSVQIL